MTNEQNKLIAAYMAGEDVAEDILAMCRRDRTFLKAVSEHASLARLIAFEFNSVSSETFIENVCQGITQSRTAKIVENTTTDLVKNSQRETVKTESLLSKITSWLFAPQLSANFTRVALFASVVMMLFTSSYWFYGTSSPKQLAYVNKVANAQSNSGRINPGDILTKGGFQLNKGYAEVTLNNGVRLVLEAPIELSLVSTDKVLLKQGNLVATVPPNAIGFMVDTPSAEIVDLGTEFGVSVAENGRSEVHVLTGEIKARADNSKKFVHLKENEARVYQTAHDEQVIASNANLFMRTLPGESPDNPDYLHWSFDQSIDNSFACDGTGIDGKCYPAFLKSLTTEGGVKKANGQFGDGVYFDGQDAWLETEFPGIGGAHPRTVAFWVKVPNDFAITNGYGILSWGLPEPSSAWQISPNPAATEGPLGRIRIGTNQAQVIGSTDLRDTRWHHIAIVLFGGSDVDLSTHVLMYVDGELEKSSNKSMSKVFTELADPQSKPLTIGKNIGYRLHNKKVPFKFFRGWLDELYIFNSALNQAQINNLITNNRLVNKAQ